MEINNEIKTKISDHLKETMGRDAKPHEIVNAEKDVGILVPLILDAIEELDRRLKKLEK